MLCFTCGNSKLDYASVSIPLLVVLLRFLIFETRLSDFVKLASTTFWCFNMYLGLPNKMIAPGFWPYEEEQ